MLVGRRVDKLAAMRRRLKAAKLLNRGRSQADVARILDVSRTSVSRWAKVIRQSPSALRKIGIPGRRSKIPENTFREIARVFKDIADRGVTPGRANFRSGLLGFGGVRFHRSHEWRVWHKFLRLFPQSTPRKQGDPS
jgi:predicted transcriptional regulator